MDDTKDRIPNVHPQCSFQMYFGNTMGCYTKKSSHSHPLFIWQPNLLFYKWLACATSNEKDDDPNKKFTMRIA